MSHDKSQNLISAGNEIIANSSSPKLNNIDNISNINKVLTTKEETVTKTINDDIIKSAKKYTDNNIHNNNYTQRNLFLHTAINPNESRKSTYYNLSKLNYKDGLILKDAANSNPGYGLWAVKLSEGEKPLKKLEEENNSTNKYNSNIYSNKLYNNVNSIKLNENSLSESNINSNSNYNSNDNDTLELIDINSYEEDVDKLIINQLTKRSNKLEKKYKKILIKYYEQENLYLNLEKLKKEYEQLVNESIKEKNEIQKNCEKVDNNNQALMNSISNARKEIERLIMVIKEEQIKMKNEIEEYNKQLVEEELKRKNIITKIKYTEKQIYILQDKIEDEKNENNIDINTKTNTNTGGTNTSRDFNKTKNDKIEKSKLLLDEKTKQFYKVKKESRREKDYKIKQKIEKIKELQEELERLKIEDEEKLKEKRDLFELINEKNNNKKIYKINMDKMYNQLEIEERKNKWNSSAIKIRNNIINSLKRYSNSK